GACRRRPNSRTCSSDDQRLACETPIKAGGFHVCSNAAKGGSKIVEHATSLFVVILAGRGGGVHEGATRSLVGREGEGNGVREGGEGVESASCCDQPRGSPTRSLNLGRMFWLWWNTLSGSYLVFTSTSRS